MLPVPSSRASEMKHRLRQRHQANLTGFGAHCQPSAIGRPGDCADRTGARPLDKQNITAAGLAQQYRAIVVANGNQWMRRMTSHLRDRGLARNAAFSRLVVTAGWVESPANRPRAAARD